MPSSPETIRKTRPIKDAQRARASCSVCRSEKVGQVDTLLKAGISIGNIADETAFAKSVIWRHKRHMNILNANDLLVAAEGQVLGERSRIRSITYEKLAGMGLLGENLDKTAFDPKMNALVRSMAAIHSAEDLKQAIQMVVVESARVYEDAKGAGNRNQQLNALKQVGWGLVVLGKAQGWITADPVLNDNRQVNLFGDLGKETMLMMRDVLADIAGVPPDRARNEAGQYVGADDPPAIAAPVDPLPETFTIEHLEVGPDVAISPELEQQLATPPPNKAPALTFDDEEAETWV